MNSNHVTTLEIDLKAIAHNVNYFKSKIKPTTKILVVVKAFGYGSDATLIANFLEKQPLVDYFAVAYTHEGISLRKNGITKPILVLHPQVENCQNLIDYTLEPNCYSFYFLDAFTAILKEKNIANYPIHIKINTGLNRLGFHPSEMDVLEKTLQQNTNISVQSIFSHLAASEDLDEKEFTTNQIHLFKKLSEQLCNALPNKPILHMLNTSGIVNYAKQAQFDMVRLGIGMYGFANEKSETDKLQNVMSLKSIISQIHTIKKGETIGYNRAFKAEKEIKMATVPIGHADGISRRLGNKKAVVIINTKKAHIIGNVCMDMIMVDVSDIDCKEGDQVIIFDSQAQINAIANASDTISYEVITALSQRIRRVLK